MLDHELPHSGGGAHGVHFFGVADRNQIGDRLAALGNAVGLAALDLAQKLGKVRLKFVGADFGQFAHVKLLKDQT